MDICQKRLTTFMSSITNVQLKRDSCTVMEESSETMDDVWSRSSNELEKFPDNSDQEKKNSNSSVLQHGGDKGVQKQPRKLQRWEIPFRKQPACVGFTDSNYDSCDMVYVGVADTVKTHSR